MSAINSEIGEEVMKKLISVVMLIFFSIVLLVISIYVAAFSGG
jgi:hypothetical protein